VLHFEFRLLFEEIFVGSSTGISSHLLVERQEGAPRGSKAKPYAASLDFLKKRRANSKSESTRPIQEATEQNHAKTEVLSQD
jgi:hypothetical protein